MHEEQENVAVSGHARLLVHMKDEKYGLGIFEATTINKSANLRLEVVNEASNARSRGEISDNVAEREFQSFLKAPAGKKPDAQYQLAAQECMNTNNAGDKVVAEKENEGLDYYAKKNGMERLVVPDIMAVLEREPGKVLLIDMHDRSRLEKYKNSMEEWGRDKVEMYFSSREFLEVVPKGINKGNAVRAYCDMFHIPAANTVAAGDEQNDLPMILAAGVGCAAANAVDEVKAGADYVTENDNNHSAVAEIIRKFMLS